MKIWKQRENRKIMMKPKALSTTSTLVLIVLLCPVHSFVNLCPSSLSCRSSSPSILFLREPKILVAAEEDQAASFVENNDNELSNDKEPSFQATVLSTDASSLTSETSSSSLDSFNKKAILLLLWFIACLSALDRVAMSVALVPLSDSSPEYFTDSVKGSISSFFSVGYGIGIIPAGLIVMALSPRTVMASGIVVWSAATLATPWGITWMLNHQGSLAPLMGLRAAVGMGESIVIPTIQRTLSVWTKETEKSRAVAWIFSGFAAGTLLAYTISPVILEAASWEGLFYVYGGIGVCVLFPWLLLAKDTPSSPKSLPQSLETTTLVADETSTTNMLQSMQNAPWGEFVRSRGVWGMLLAHSAKNWGLYSNLAWTPTFYAEQYGLSVSESALLSVAPSLAGAAGGFIAGWTADSLLQQFNVTDTTPIRKLFQSVAFLGSALALGTLALRIPESAETAQWFLIASVGLQSFNAAGFEAANQEKAGPKWTGLLYSVTTLPAVWFGTLGVWLTGQVLDATQQDWSFIFAMNAGVNVMGAIAFITLFDSRREFD